MDAAAIQEMETGGLYFQLVHVKLARRYLKKTSQV
jgi:hypothetical protein